MPMQRMKLPITQPLIYRDWSDRTTTWYAIEGGAMVEVETGEVGAAPARFVIQPFYFSEQCGDNGPWIPISDLALCRALHVASELMRMRMRLLGAS